ncbi:helix-turn-helix domain-containing protein [Roseovarius sp. 2305UL8-3]|uniref:helix-turn-helix domain-containing protein n=1 Tax=Roseovarius conchicola TaxID=3121636 RepID=UPI003527DF7A
MIGRLSKRKEAIEEVEPKGFDDFDLRLGDVMRGERATLGKSLLDVERELRIKASYIAAIENSDPDAFDTPGFIPGYVRSYARYLNMDPDKAFRSFCVESGFSIAHGMSAEASSIRKADDPIRRKARDADPLMAPNTPFLPASESFLARIEPGAIGSVAVLIALIGAIGYGGYSVLNEVQQVQLAPVENTPDVLADLDPLAGMSVQNEDVIDIETVTAFQAPATDGLDRLYRPEALDVPVMVARDAPISTLDPSRVGALNNGVPQADRDSDTTVLLAEDTSEIPPSVTPQVLEDFPPELRIVAVRPAWVRVTAADGSSIFEGVMNAGDSYDVPATEEPPTLRVGESGAIYFAMNGDHYGPVGPSGSVTSNVPLASTTLAELYTVADISQDRDLERYVAELKLGQ